MFIMEIKIALIVLACINLLSFFVMAKDKGLSMGNSKDRIPEGIIFFIAAAGGSLGIYLAMLTLRHKTRKWYFMLGMPLLILENAATVLVIKQLWF